MWRPHSRNSIKSLEHSRTTVGKWLVQPIMLQLWSVINTASDFNCTGLHHTSVIRCVGHYVALLTRMFTWQWRRLSVWFGHLSLCTGGTKLDYVNSILTGISSRNIHRLLGSSCYSLSGVFRIKKRGAKPRGLEDGSPPAGSGRSNFEASWSTLMANKTPN